MTCCHPERRRLGFIVYAEGNGCDGILRAVVDGLRRGPARLGGVVQHNQDVAHRRHCTMTLEDLYGGGHIQISEFRGNGARGCRLDRSALATASARIHAAIEAGVDLIVINKFGKTEAEGNGLIAEIAEAAARGIAVLIAVPERNLDAWREFAADLAIELPADPDALLRWCLAMAGQRSLETA